MFKEKNPGQLGVTKHFQKLFRKKKRKKLNHSNWIDYWAQVTQSCFYQSACVRKIDEHEQFPLTSLMTVQGNIA